MINLNEAKDLDVFKGLIVKFEEFTDRYPMTGISRIFKDILDRGLKVIPKDRTALDILYWIVKRDTDSKTVHDLLNLSFSDLPPTVRPIYKVGNRKLTAFWCKKGKVYDKVFSLLDFDGSRGYWSDELGNKVGLIDKKEVWYNV